MTPEEPSPLPVEEVGEGVIAFSSSLYAAELQPRAMLGDNVTHLTESDGNMYVIAVRYTTKTGTAYGATGTSLLIDNDELLLQPVIDTVKMDTLYRTFLVGDQNQHYYWPENTLTTAGDKVDFYAYFVTKAVGSGDINVSVNSGNFTIDYTLRGSSINKQIDLLYDANPDNMKGFCKKPNVAPKPVKLKMKHALTQIRFRMASSSHRDIKLEEVDIADVNMSGCFDLQQRKFMTNDNPNTLYLYPNNGEVVQPQGLGKENASKNYISTALIPTEWTDKTITATIDGVKFDLVICKGGKALEAGYIYDFTLTYNGKAIEVAEPVVVDWTAENGGGLLD